MSDVIAWYAGVQGMYVVVYTVSITIRNHNYRNSLAITNKLSRI